MHYNKNGLEIKLNFDYSVNDKDLPEQKQQTNNNKQIISNNVSSITFLPKPKEIILEEYSNNFELISRLKRQNNYIINKISKIEFLKTSQNKTESPKLIFEINKIDSINIVNSNIETKKEVQDVQPVVEKETEKQNTKESKLFINLNNVNENNFFISGKKIEIKYDIEYKINNIEIYGKGKEDTKKEEKKDVKEEVKDKIKEEVKENEKDNAKEKKFDVINIESKTCDVELINVDNKEKEKDKDKQKEIKTYRNEPVEIKAEPKEKTSKEDKEKEIKTYRNEPVEIKAEPKKEKTSKENKEKDVKTFRNEPIEIKAEHKERILNIESNNFFQINSNISKPKPKKIKFDIQKGINNVEIIQNKQIYQNVIEKNIVNIEIKRPKNKKNEILFKKVDNFINSNDKLQSKKKLLKNINDSSNEINEKEIKKNQKELNSKMDIYKTKSPNQIKISRVAPHKTNLNNYVMDMNNINNENYIRTDQNIEVHTLNNEKLNNKESIQIPVINNDIIHLERQYEKIKKDLNELYPIFSKNKQYRENFFVQLSQGNQGKYNFYLSLYKIIKDEQEEKKNNNFDNYLKMKKIIDGKSSGQQHKYKTKLKPLKKNSSSCSIIARNKMFPSYTEGNNNY